MTSRIETTWCLTARCSESVGVAVPMSIPRYTTIESVLTISAGRPSRPRREQTRTANPDFPLAVGPRRQMTGKLTRSSLRTATTLRGQRVERKTSHEWTILCVA